MITEITSLEKCVQELPSAERTIFDAIFSYTLRTGEIEIPDSFKQKAYGYCKRDGESEEDTIKRVSRQTIARVINKYTREQALFNELRTSKPGSNQSGISQKRKIVEEDIEKSCIDGKCDFRNPDKYTSSDSADGINLPGCCARANLAMYDAANGIIVFKRHNPLRISLEDFSEGIDAASEWFKRKHSTDPELAFPFLGWNCLEKAGASQIHAHMHALLASNWAYEGVEKLRLAAKKYAEDTKSDYFDDLFNNN